MTGMSKQEGDIRQEVAAQMKDLNDLAQSTVWGLVDGLCGALKFLEIYGRWEQAARSGNSADIEDAILEELLILRTELVPQEQTDASKPN